MRCPWGSRYKTITDFGDPYAVGGDGLPTADNVGALRRLGNALPNMKTGYFTEQFKDKALNPDVPVLQRQAYGATLPLVLGEQMGIGLINAPGKIVSAVDSLLGVFTEPTTEGSVISGLTFLRDSAEGILGLAPLIPISRLTATIKFGEAGAGAGAEGSVARVGTTPDWLLRFERGNAFNAERASAYPYNEVFINKPSGVGYYRLDSYNPTSGEIVSRKFTQLSEVQEKTAITYINELSLKYPVNGTIANVPSSGSLGGKPLLGQQYLEVPVQLRPVPQSVLDAANSAGVVIRDIKGRIH